MSGSGEVTTQWGNESTERGQLASRGNESAEEGGLGDEFNRPLFEAIISLLYGVVAVMGVGGNQLVIYAVLHNRAMRTVQNLFICSLAAANILISLFSATLTPVSSFTSWPFGDVMCRLFGMSTTFNVCVNSLTCVAIAAHRFRVLLWPLLTDISIRCALLVIALIWLASLTATLPQALFYHVENELELVRCAEAWPPDHNAMMIFYSFIFCFQFLLPTIAISFCYCCIFYAMRARQRQRAASRAVVNHTEQRRQTRLTWMLAAMVVLFFGAWLPFYTLMLIEIYTPDPAATLPFYYYQPILMLCTLLLGLTSTTYNPFLYGYMNENFRREFHSIWNRWRCRRQRSATNYVREHHPAAAAPFGDDKYNIPLDCEPSPPEPRIAATMTMNMHLADSKSPAFAASNHLGRKTPIGDSLLQPMLEPNGQQAYSHDQFED